MCPLATRGFSCGMSFRLALARSCVHPRRQPSQLRLMPFSCITIGADSARGKPCVPLRLAFASATGWKLTGYTSLLLFSMHCAWLLTVASELLWVFVVHTLCVGTRALSSDLFPCPHAVCRWDACLLGVRVSALLCETQVPQPCGHQSLGEALLRRAFRPPCARCHWRRVPWPASAVEVLGWPSQSPLGCSVSHVCDLWLLRPLLPLLTRHLWVSGCHSTNSAFCWLTSLRNRWSLSCRVAAGPGVAPASTRRQLTLPTHLETHLEALVVDTHCGLISIFTSRLSFSAGIFVSFHRWLISSFVSRFMSSTLPVVISIVPIKAYFPSATYSLTQAVVCGVCCLLDTSLLRLLTFTHAALLGCCWLGISWYFWSGGARCPSWALMRLLRVLLHTRSVSVCIVWSVADSFLLASHCLHWVGCLLGEVSCSCRVAVLRLSPIVSAKSLVRGCSPVGTHRGPDQCHCWLWRLRRHGFLTALHDEREPVCRCGCIDCGFESIIGGMEEPLTCTPCSSLTSSGVLEPQQLAHGVRCLWLLCDCNLPLATHGTEGIPDLHFL